MALPASPSVVVIENDVSIYTPNVQSSVVGIVGFADKGPINTPTLITSQENLLRKFGKPKSAIPGQGLEGALEILEATNQIYYVRAANSPMQAQASALIGFCPALQLSGFTSVDANATSITYSINDGNGVERVSNGTITLASSLGVTTPSAIFQNAFDTSITGDRDIFGYIDDSGAMIIASRYAGEFSLLTVECESLQFEPFVLSGGVTDDQTIIGSSTSAHGGVASLDGADGLYLNVYSKYPGEGYNLSGLRDGTTQGISVEVDSVSILDKLTINSDGAAVESFTVQLSPSSSNSVELLLVDDESNNKSDYVYAVIESNGVGYEGIPNQFGEKLTTEKSFVFSGAGAATGTPRFVKLVEGTFGMVGGDSGYSTNAAGSQDDRAAIIGAATDKTGIYALDDDFLNISIAIVPGFTNQQVQNALITLAESSKNFIAIVSPPQGLSEVQDAVDWMNGRGARTAAINSSYAAVYWPEVQVFNFYAGADEWYDPAIFAVRQMVYTDSVSEPWFAPAGYRRGRLTKPSNVWAVLNQGDKDALYTNNINPITKEVQAGITVFGQKTAQRLPTALDRANVRRLMIFIRKTLLQLGKPFQFEPSDQFTWELVEDSLQPFIDDLISRRAIVAGEVKCDSSTNTPLRVDRNELWCYVTIKPTKAAETVVIQVNLTNQSAVING